MPQMPQIIFAFTFNPETKEAVFSGNVKPAIALKILQEIVITDAVANAETARRKAEKPAKGKK